MFIVCHHLVLPVSNSLSLSLSPSVSSCLSICLSMCLPAYLSLSVCLSVCISLNSLSLSEQTDFSSIKDKELKHKQFLIKLKSSISSTWQGTRIYINVREIKRPSSRTEEDASAFNQTIITRQLHASDIVSAQFFPRLSNTPRLRTGV